MTRYATIRIWNASEGARVRPPGAGAASGRSVEQPRFGLRRGRREGRRASFYARLYRRPRAERRGSGGDKFACWRSAQANELSPVRGSARLMTAPVVGSASGKGAEPRQPSSPAKETLAATIDAQGEEGPGADSELAALLEAIAEDVHSRAAAACAQISAESAAAVTYALKHLPRPARTAALAALAQTRKAKLVLVRRNASLEIAGRKKAAIAARRRRRPNKTIRELPPYARSGAPKPP